MFQFRRFPTHTYLIQYALLRLLLVGFPIRISPDQCLFAAPRSFSQLITSFIGSWCQGIPLALLLAWPRRGKRRLLRFRPRPAASGENYAHSVAPPLKFEPASLGFKFVPKSKAPCWSIWSASNLEKSNIGSLIQNYAGSLRSLS